MYPTHQNKKTTQISQGGGFKNLFLPVKYLQI